MNLKLHKWEDLGKVIYCKEKVSNNTDQRGIERTSEDLMDLKRRDVGTLSALKSRCFMRI